VDENTLQVVSNDPLDFFEFGMDRIDVIPGWRGMGWGYPILHLGPGKKGEQIDTLDLEYPEYDFEQADCLGSWNDDSVGGIVATHVLEHLRDPRPLIWECARVLMPGWPMNIVVPKAGSNLWNQDLDHKTGFVLDTWKTLLDSSFYKKGKKQDHGLVVGFNMEMSIKEGNNVIVTQLVKGVE
jgi:SAM-dependent methyltransferase